MSQGRVFLEEFTYSCSIGCTEAERAFPQPITVDLTAEVDFSKVLPSLDLKHGLDWAQLDALLSRVISGEKWILAEQLADRLCVEILEAFPAVKSISLRVRKFPFPHGNAVGVEIERSR